MVLTKAMEEIRNVLSNNDKQNTAKQAEMIATYNLSMCTSEDIAQIIVPFIDRLLNNVEHRQDAFHILDNLLLKLPIELVQEKSVLWCRHCISDKPFTALQLSVLIKMIQVCHGVKDFDSHLTQHFAEIIHACLSKQPCDDIRKKLDCVTLCVTYYPKMFAQFRNEIENTLSFYLSSSCARDVIKKVGTLFHTLQEVPIVNQSNLQQNWTAQFYKLCSTINHLYDDFLEGFEFHRHNYSEEVPPFDDVYLTVYSSDKVGQFVQVYNQLRNLVVFATCMLETRFSQPKKLKISVVMDVLQRGLTVETYEKKEPPLEHGIVTVLQRHQIDLLHLFRALITCFSKQLLPLSARITKLIVTCQELSQRACFPRNSEYHVALYELMSRWVVLSHNDGDVIPFNKIIPLLLLEITPTNASDMLCLNKSAKSSAYTAQKMQNILRSQKIEDRSLQIDERACTVILKALTCMMSTVELGLNEANINALFQVLVQVIEAIQRGNISHPYTNQECVAALYKAFASLFMQEYYRRRPFYELAINILRDGQNCDVKNDFRITYVIMEALQIITSMCRSAS
uniref:Uncharacterized protein n=1 Tax=Photinus pyralis TaxID=7054 RepID=A0A1Y1MY06_PHOPY